MSSRADFTESPGLEGHQIPGDTLAPWAWRSCFARQPAAGQRRGGLARQEPRGGGGFWRRGGSELAEAVLRAGGLKGTVENARRGVGRVLSILSENKVTGQSLLRLTLDEQIAAGIPLGPAKPSG
ncbi:unnamed protein product [Effrenium voratum]|uniref:Uncharacterized protein n=1 Tax=Effrenium voratum TaxID=2562239 RepID=A0AA36N395_9DINO|nr:unnamed protein product [Effrenium voratum]CAJ1387991.1 unnamed protein product [Effrenium voratum]CAJ1443823.1 unnamed protein product [Effrenium voratum]CAJ1448091.1 unnamed protein product [Effrenium voratum]